jgi:hypothetical protein
MDRYWFLTSTTYGNWLPGDPRGFVSGVEDDDGATVIHNQPMTEYDRDIPGLREYAQGQLQGPPITFKIQQAEVMLRQFHETATHRKWELRAVGIMGKHIHLVVGVVGDPDPYKVKSSATSKATPVVCSTRNGANRSLRDVVDGERIGSQTARRGGGSRGNRICPESGESAVDLDRRGGSDSSD